MKDKTEGARQAQRSENDHVPYKFLSRLDNRMPLRYRKLWFRLTCPQGRIRIIAHFNTTETASCTAEVYLNKKDPKPVSSCTAACSRKETEDFLKAAENRALTGALIQAGFTRPEKIVPAHKRSGSPAPEPVSPAAAHAVGRQPQRISEKAEKKKASQEQAKTTGSKKDIPVQPVPSAKAADGMADSFHAAGTADPIPFPGSEKAEAASAGALPSGEISEQKSPRQADPRQTADPVPASTARTGKTEALPLPPAAKEQGSPLPSAGQTAYTSSTPVEEIRKYMTLEDALHTRVTIGACNGMTLEEIGRERFPFLRWYVYGYNGNDNILRTAAQIVLDSLQEGNKAG